LTILVPLEDRNVTDSRRNKPISRTFLVGEQPNPWYLIQHQDKMRRHRGIKPSCQYELSRMINLLSPA